MDITVAICTRNRAASLRRTLQYFLEMELPQRVWELLVVDNGSSDETAKVIDSFAGRLPIRREFEAKPGLSNARNRAVAAAQGEYILWTDDDVAVDRHWLASYACAFERWPDTSLFGGPIIPVLEEPCVPWFRNNLALIGGIVGERNLADTEIPLSCTGGRLPYGGNFAIRAKEQRLFPYDPSLGVAPGRRRAGEETAIFTSMLQQGYLGRWVPGAKISHLVPRKNQTVRYVRNYSAALGETQAQMEGAPPAPVLFGMPRWRVRRLLSLYLSYRITRLTAGPEVWLKKLIELGHDQGMLAYWRQNRKPGLTGWPARASRCG